MQSEALQNLQQPGGAGLIVEDDVERTGKDQDQCMSVLSDDNAPHGSNDTYRDLQSQNNARQSLALSMIGAESAIV